jgi:hypothetical protein
VTKVSPEKETPERDEALPELSVVTAPKQEAAPKKKNPREISGVSDFDVRAVDHGENENSSFRYVPDSLLA